jgi:heterodisulfide reductase subunit A
MLNVDLAESGYIDALYSKFKTTETKQAGVFVAGTASSPADIPTSLLRAGYAASHLDDILSKQKVEKRFPVADIDTEKCTLCELCVTACPFSAIDIIQVENPGVKMVVDPARCMGCGQCSSTCPADAVDIDYYEEDQLLKQVEGVLFDKDSNPDPLIVCYTCWECGYATTDAAGISAFHRPETLVRDHPGTYSPNVRIVPVQCTGNVSARLINKTFAMGADGILVLGCYEDKCHYETGSQASSTRVKIMKTMLEFSGIDPRRLEKETDYFMGCVDFMTTQAKMTRTLKKIGKLER